MNKKFFSMKKGSVVVMSAALLGMFASCAEKRNAEHEAAEETAQIEQAQAEAPQDTRSETLNLIDEMVSVVENEPGTPEDQLKKYDGAFFTNPDNQASTPTQGKYSVTPTGLKFVVVTKGEGPAPTANNTVTVHYTGMLTDGTVFDSSISRGEPTSFPLNAVIPGWTEGLQLMRPGGTTVFYIPSELGYGERGVPGVIPGDAPLIFWVNLLEVN